MLYKTFAKDCSGDLAIYLLFRTKTIHVGRCDHSAVPVCDLVMWWKFTTLPEVEGQQLLVRLGALQDLLAVQRRLRV
ncbi:hypothetical protein DVH05_018754 [Phytophthora capsici]|nr:hypothetical protein DVH05_018754 [Phytophthora capsici]